MQQAELFKFDGLVAGVDEAGRGPLAGPVVASAVVLDAGAAADCPVAALVAANPYAAFARIAQLLHPQPAVAAGIHPSAVVDSGVSVAPDAAIGAQAVIEAGAVIGPRVLVGPGSIVMAGATSAPDPDARHRTRPAPRPPLRPRGRRRAAATHRDQSSG